MSVTSASAPSIQAAMSITSNTGASTWPAHEDESFDVQESFTIGDAVTTSQGSGIVRFCGNTSFSPGEWIGVELDVPNGKNDGSVKGVRYFDCEANHGVFTRRSACEKTSDSDAPQGTLPRGGSLLANGAVHKADSSSKKPRKAERDASGTSKVRVSKNPHSGASGELISTPQDPSSPSEPAQQRTNRSPAPQKSAKAAVASKELLEALEKRDLDRLRQAIPAAAAVGVAPAELEVARNVMLSETHRLLLDEVATIQNAVRDLGLAVQNAAAGGLSGSTSTGSAAPNRGSTGSAGAGPADTGIMLEELRQSFVQELRAELRQSRDDMRHSFLGLEQNLRQDLASIHGDVKGIYSAAGEIVRPTSPAGRPISPALLSPAATKVEELPSLLRNSVLGPEAKVAKRLVAVIKGREERRELRRREMAAGVIVRGVRRLKMRWDAHAANGESRSFHAVATAARSRNQFLSQIFDNLRQDKDGLNKEEFLQAMGKVHPRLHEEQNEALWTGFVKGTHRTMFDFRGFNAVCDAVTEGDREAAEFADLTFEQFSQLAHVPHHLVGLKFHKSRGHSLHADAAHAAAEHAAAQLQAKPADGSEIVVYDIDLHQADARQNMELYYNICSQSVGLMVTTSCFTLWRQNNRINQYGKLVPAVPVDAAADTEGVTKLRVFFFDDNLDLDGSEGSSGLCNIRNVTTGAFVNFGVGQNGFQRAQAGRHTIVMHSPKYRNVLVKAHVLDAYEDKNYFTSIIQKYSKPGEKVVVIMDVNSTILCCDSAQGKGVLGSLLSSIFGIVELRPREPFDFVWDGMSPVKVDKPIMLRQLVRKICNGYTPAYRAFWKEETCNKLVDELAKLAELRWCSTGESISGDVYRAYFKSCSAAVAKEGAAEGSDAAIAPSWFHMLNTMKERCPLMLNSFGVDTLKVIRAAGCSERSVMQMAVNVDTWDVTEVKKFQSQFQSGTPRFQKASLEALTLATSKTSAACSVSPIGITE